MPANLYEPDSPPNQLPFLIHQEELCEPCLLPS